MKKRTKRLLAMLLASAMILQQGSTVAVLATESEPTSETVTEKTAAAEAETKTPETKAPETQAETKASETTASETQATEAAVNATQTETTTSETTETAAETTGKATEAQTAAPEESETKADAEAETKEAEEKAAGVQVPKTNFTYEDNRVKITAVAQEAAKLPQDAQIHADYMQPGTVAYNEAAAALEAAYASKDVVLSYVFYDIYFTAASVGNGRIEPEAGTVTVSIQFKQPELTPETDTKIQTYDVVHVENGKAQEVPSTVQTTGDGSVASVGFTSSDFSPYAVVMSVEKQDEVATIGLDEEYGIMPIASGDIYLGTEESGSITAVDVKTKNGNEWVEWNPDEKYPRNQDFQFRLDYSFNNAVNKPTKENPCVYYTLPECLEGISIPGAEDGKGRMYGEDGTQIGWYSIEGNVLKFEYFASFFDEANSDIKGYFTFEAQIKSSSSNNKKDLTVEFPGASTNPKIQFEDGKVEGNKSFGNKNADGTTDVTITFTVTGETAENVTVRDVLGDNLNFVENSFSLTYVLTDGGTYTPPTDAAIEAALRNGGKCTLGDLPIGTYTISYKVSLKDKDKLDSTSNTVFWDWESNPDEGEKKKEATVTFQQHKLEKNDGVQQEDGTIKWEIVVTPDQFSTVLGKTVTDTLGEGQHYTGNITVSRGYYPNVFTGSIESFIQDGKFVYTFPAEGYPDSEIGSNITSDNYVGQAFRITYYTEPDNKELNKEYTNTADDGGGPDDGKVDYDPSKNKEPGPEGEDKGIVEKTGVYTGVIGGTATIDWTIIVDPKEYEDVNDLILEDALDNAGWLQSSFLKDSLKVEKQSGETWGTFSDYTIEWTPTEIKPTGFKIKVKGEITDKIKVTIQSISENNALIEGNWQSNNLTSTYTVSGEPGVEKEKPGVQMKGVKTEFKKTGTLDGRTATWTVTANKKADSDNPAIDLRGDDYYIKDVLPEGMSYVEGSASYILYGDNGKVISGPTKVSPEISGDLNTLTFKFDDVEKNYIVLTYQTIIEGEISEEKSYENTAQFGTGEKVLGNASSEVTVESTILTKKGMLAQNVLNGLHYSIQVNHAGKDLFPDSDKVTLYDIMDVNTSILLNTLKVVHMITGEDVEYSVRIGTTDDGQEKLTITVPDETPVTISYDVTVAGKVGDSVTVTNTVKFDGELSDSVTEENSVVIQKSLAGASGRQGSITIRKIDGDTLKTLAGAEFSLYVINLRDTPINREGTLFETGTTGESGTVTFPAQESKALELDQLYYFVETNAPAGYKLDEGRHYFVIKGDSYSTAVEKINGLGIRFSTYAGGNTITISNEKEEKFGNLTVTKNVAGNNTDITTKFHFKVTLTNSDGTPAAVNNTFGDVTFTNGVATFDLTPGSSGTASKTITGLPAGLKYKVEEYTNAGENTGYTLTGKTGDEDMITADSTKTAVFTNTRNKTTAKLQVKKTYNGVFPTKEGEKFSFTLEAGSNDVTSAISTPMPEGAVTSKKTIEAPSKNAVTFGEITYEEDGIYNYTITENSGSLHGVTYDTSVYHVKVKVTTDGTGAKKAEISVAKAENAKTSVGDRDYQLKEGTIYTAEFNNTYVADGSAELSVQKVYNGDAFPTDDKAFRFTLTAGDNTVTSPTKVETPMPAGSSTDGTKTVPVTSGAVRSFGTIKYEQDGNYFYTIKEVTTGTGLLSDVIYDAKVYHIKVSVTTETKGETATKKATVSYSLSAEGPWTDTNQAAFTATFTNYKIQDAKAELKVKKTYAYATWPTDDNAFKFELTGKESKKTDGTEIDTPMPTPSVIQVSKDNPTATFGEITFPADGTYLYQISEQEGALTEEITYDDTVYDVKISVSTNTDGSRNVVIQSKKSTEGEESYAPVSGTVFTAEFVNIHKEKLTDASGSLTLNATKTMKKDSDKSRIPEFQFELAWAGTGSAPAEQTLPMTVNAAADGTISFTLDFDMDDYEAAHPETGDPKEFKYTLKEVKGSDADVIYDDTTYNITVTLGNEIGTDDKFGVTYTVEGNKALTFINDTKTEVQIEKVDEEGKALSGAKLVIRDASGKIVDGPWISDGKPHSVKLLNGKYTLSEIEAPAGYEVSKDVPFEVPDKEGNTVIKVKMTDKKIVETKRSLKVTKRLHLDGITSDIMVRAATYYVALFTDAARTQRVTDVKKIVFNNENTSSATFDNLAAGVTYYVGETDENGTVIPAGKISENMIYYPTYDDNATFKFEGKKAKEEGLAEFTNVYTEWPKYFYLSGQLTVTKQVLLGGEECDSEDTFYARVFNDAKLTDPVSDEVLVLDMAGGSRTSVTVTNLPIGDTPESSRKYYVAETDEYGNPLDPDEVTEYTISIDKSEVTLDASSAGAEVVITNDFHEEESEFESESEVDEKKTAPKTGDDTNFAKYLFLLTLSAGTCAVLFEEKRRKDRAEQ